MIIHTDCKDLLTRACFPCLNFPSQGSVSDFVNADENPKVPAILQLFINEIETRGLISHEVGLYRVNGSDLQVKQIKEKFFKRHQVPDVRKVNEVHVLCSFVKDFLNNLNEHLITYDSWHRFSKICEIQNENEKIIESEQAILALPDANRDTLAFLILHLQRISETIECKMPASNLARVFGPSIVGNSSPNKSPAEIINELKIQHQVVENLIKIPSSFYFGVLDSNEQPQKLFKISSKTPESMRKSKTAVVLSSILGPATNLPSSYSIQSAKLASK
ncbi:rac GTPase-activating 1-like [Brachionus plicatilis]|uniref:Rac GTPase-activating 1-like n=1 Tax=Brachionus plicatilis TaxID=10195 RepID=A0A3M7P9F0_BRAPC|nr:rac GTPase-activating 1-like [Brachionus plicatilis]